ncbi:hypothetical protein Pelo_7596 [Pelomyxa schiedti]|nr:hypothetical protein Pelo_7596 [Pelomyxa schiedti]
MASSTTRTVPHLPQPQGQPTIVVHLSARDQFAALATSSHSRCGARSPARLMTSQPALLIQLPNSGRSWPPSQSTASSVSVFEWDHDGVLHYEAMSVAPIRDTLLTNIAPESSNNKHGVGTGMVVNGVCEMVFSIAASSFLLRVPSVVTDDGEGGNKGSELLIHKEGAFDVGSANCKWMVHSCMGLRGFRLVRLSDCSAKRIPVSESGERMRALYDNQLVSVFFNKSNEDEAVMVVEGFTMVAVDLAESFLTGFARVLSETSWGIRKPSMYSAIENVLVFNNGTHSGNRLLITLLRRKVIVREEGTASWGSIISKNVLRLSQLDDTMFCVSLTAEYQLWDSTNIQAGPIPISCDHRDGAQPFVTAERGFLFHHQIRQKGTEIHVTGASTGVLLMHLTNLPPHSKVAVSSFENGKAEL